MKISDVASSDNQTYNNDMTQTYVFNNAGEMLYPLRAVTKLGMFMTKRSTLATSIVRIQELLKKNLDASGRGNQNLGYKLVKNGSNTSVVLENI